MFVSPPVSRMVWEPQLSSTQSLDRGAKTQRGDVGLGTASQFEVELVRVPVLLTSKPSFLSFCFLSLPKPHFRHAAMSAVASGKAPRPAEHSAASLSIRAMVPDAECQMALWFPVWTLVYRSVGGRE